MKYRRHGTGRNKTMDRMVRSLDKLALYEEFQEKILPALREDLRNGTGAEEILKKYQAFIAARGVTIALTELDSSKALSAIRDVLDRAGGKATEKKEVTHKLEKLPEEELDALLLTRMKEMDESGDD